MFLFAIEMLVDTDFAIPSLGSIERVCIEFITISANFDMRMDGQRLTCIFKHFLGLYLKGFSRLRGKREEEFLDIEYVKICCPPNGLIHRQMNGNCLIDLK